MRCRSVKKMPEGPIFSTFRYKLLLFIWKYLYDSNLRANVKPRKQHDKRFVGAPCYVLWFVCLKTIELRCLKLAQVQEPMSACNPLLSVYSYYAYRNAHLHNCSEYMWCLQNRRRNNWVNHFVCFVVVVAAVGAYLFRMKFKTRILCSRRCSTQSEVWGVGEQKTQKKTI